MQNKWLGILESKKTVVGLMIFIFCESCYSFTNYLTNTMDPHVLPFSSVDHAVPFFPLSVWIYLSEVIICVAAFYTARDVRNIARYVGSLISITILAVICFMFFPTVFPRLHFPLPADVDQYTLGLFNWLRRVDYPTNCLPSLHVCYSYLASFVFLQEQRSKFPFYFTWATLIAISTLTTKQHYFLDVVVGSLFAFSTYRLFLYLIPPNPGERIILE